MNQSYDVVVIGAGIVGSAVAYRLARAGRRVLIVEAGEPASGASGNSFSWLNAVSKEPEAYHRLNADGLAEYAGLGEELGVDIGLHGGGSFGWADAEEAQRPIEARVARLAARGYPAEWISREQALRLEPGLSIGAEVAGVAYHPGDGWVDAPRLVRALVNRTLAEGGDLWRGARVESLRRAADRVTGAQTDRGVVAAEQVVLCAGTGTSALLASIGARIPVRAVPGLLAITTPLSEQLGRVVYAPGVHLRPDVDGGLRIGADDIDALTSETTPADPVPEFAQSLLARASAVFPATQTAEILRVHIGIRPVPEDGHTVAGPVPGVTNAWVIATHSGITMGPLLGRLIAGEITDGAIDPRLHSFRPERFAVSL